MEYQSNCWHYETGSRGWGVGLCSTMPLKGHTYDEGTQKTPLEDLPETESLSRHGLPPSMNSASSPHQGSLLLTTQWEWELLIQTHSGKGNNNICLFSLIFFSGRTFKLSLKGQLENRTLTETLTRWVMFATHRDTQEQSVWEMPPGCLCFMSKTHSQWCGTGKVIKRASDRKLVNTQNTEKSPSRNLGKMFL